MTESITTDKVGNAFTKKIGPLPGWAWVGIVVGGAYLVHKLRGGSAPVASSSTPTTADSTAPVDYSGGAGFPGGGAGSGGVPTGPSGGSAISSNAQWGMQAFDWLVASGSDPSAVSNAVSDYLNGNPLSTTEQAIINQALRQFGTPPNGVLPITSQPTVPTPPTPGKIPNPQSPSGTKNDVMHPPSGTHYTRDAGGRIYQVWPDGATHWLSPAQYKALGSPSYSQTGSAKTSAPKPAPPSSRTYVVRPGDSLFTIASRFYGSGNAWQKIYNANQSAIGSNPSLIPAGTSLVIPS